MNVDIRKSFAKDADKLPAPVQHQLADIIELIKNISRLNEISNCKN